MDEARLPQRSQCFGGWRRHGRPGGRSESVLLERRWRCHLAAAVTLVSRMQRSVTILAASLLAGILALPVAAQDLFVIQGTIVNGTSGGGSTAGVRVQAVGFTDDRSLGSWEATTDAAGRYSIAGVPREDGATYV